MSIIKDALEKLGIKEDKRDPEVNSKLSTGNTLLTLDEYHFGNFLSRLLKRTHLVDDFRMEGIARAVFRPSMRRISLEFNPYLMWTNLLRDVAKSAGTKDAELLQVDKFLKEAFVKGGWTDKTFGLWIDFLKSQSKSGRHGYGHDLNHEQVKSCVQSLYIHELLHCMWEHIFQKRYHSKDFKDKDGNSITNMNVLENIAMDFAINQTLYFGCMDPILVTTKNKKLLHSFFKGGGPIRDEVNKAKITEENITIQDFDETLLNQPFEYYLDLILKNPDKSLQNLAESFGLGKSKLYDLFSHDGETAQFEDFNETSSDAKRVAENDLKRVVDEMLEKGEIDSASEIAGQHPFKLNSFFTKMIEGLYKTKTISWEYILRHFIRKAMGATQQTYTMKRESRANPDFFPGHERLEDIDLNIVIDVSGSINFEDFNRFMNEVEAISSAVDTPMVRYMQFHHEISLDIVVPMKKIRHLGIKSTGGTALQPVLDKLKADRNKTLTVVFTDGYIDDGYAASDYNYPVLIFISASGREYNAQALRKRGFKVVFQDGDNTWFS
jgi:predicted metal-dependent peptidase